MSKETIIISKEMRTELRKQFPDKAYSQHPTKTFLTTLKAMYVTERLNDVFGIGRWTINIEIIERTADYILVQGEFKSLDFDVILPKQFGGHKTTGKNTEIADGYKSALTDCQSKIASYLEIGIEMFKGNINVTTNKRINSDSTPWLNTKSEEWTQVTVAIEQGKLTDLNQITKFKVSKENQKLLQLLIDKIN